jgi:hypothetical protein
VIVLFGRCVSRARVDEYCVCVRVWHRAASHHIHGSLFFRGGGVNLPQPTCTYMGEAAVTSGERRKAKKVPAWLAEKLQAKYRLTSSGRAAPLMYTFWAVMREPLPTPITSWPAASSPGSLVGCVFGGCLGEGESVYTWLGYGLLLCDGVSDI